MVTVTGVDRLAGGRLSSSLADRFFVAELMSEIMPVSGARNYSRPVILFLDHVYSQLDVATAITAGRARFAQSHHGRSGSHEAHPGRPTESAGRAGVVPGPGLNGQRTQPASTGTPTGASSSQSGPAQQRRQGTRLQTQSRIRAEQQPPSAQQEH